MGDGIVNRGTIQGRNSKPEYFFESAALAAAVVLKIAIGVPESSHLMVLPAFFIWAKTTSVSSGLIEGE